MATVEAAAQASRFPVVSCLNPPRRSRLTQGGRRCERCRMLLSRYSFVSHITNCWSHVAYLLFVGRGRRNEDRLKRQDHLFLFSCQKLTQAVEHRVTAACAIPLSN